MALVERKEKFKRVVNGKPVNGERSIWKVVKDEDLKVEKKTVKSPKK